MAMHKNATTIRNIPLGKFAVGAGAMCGSVTGEFTLETLLKTIHATIFYECNTLFGLLKQYVAHPQRVGDDCERRIHSAA
jgi:hypothetical protein